MGRERSEIYTLGRSRQHVKHTLGRGNRSGSKGQTRGSCLGSRDKGFRYSERWEVRRSPAGRAHRPGANLLVPVRE